MKGSWAILATLCFAPAWLWLIAHAFVRSVMLLDSDCILNGALAKYCNLFGWDISSQLFNLATSMSWAFLYPLVIPWLAIGSLIFLVFLILRLVKFI